MESYRHNILAPDQVSGGLRMILQQYSVNQYPVQTIITWILSEEIAIPEIQRPFVWNATKVRDFIDSLYRGYPVGYLITWRNPDVRLKDGTTAAGKRILIDGQQRVTAILASILGKEIVDDDYRKKRIVIAFHPQERRFEVSNPAIQKNKSWIQDISMVFSPSYNILDHLEEYCSQNPHVDKNEVYKNVDYLKGIVNNSIGLIELNSDLDIETVTEIFIRINSQGVVLSQADFAMSKIAVNQNFGGNMLRRAIDYFCHLARTPEFYDQLIEIDSEFVQTEYFKKMAWLRNETDDLYDPSYTDMLRVAFTSKFQRGRLQDLVALISGRNFETREYEESIAEESFASLSEGIMDYINENNFKNLLMILRSAGFVDSSMIRSQNAINFAYILYLTLRSQRMNPARIESLVRKWFVLSVLTGRYSGAPESQFDYDIRRIHEQGTEDFITMTIDAELSDAFWNIGLPQQMNSSVASSPYFNVYLASQVKMHDKGFLSKDILVHDLITQKGDVHHVFPKEYLKINGYDNRTMYNQIANYVIMQSEINIAIGKRSPREYLAEIKSQCDSGVLRYGGITTEEELVENLESHCIPLELMNMEAADYPDFLAKRRKLMAKKIKRYFEML